MQIMLKHRIILLNSQALFSERVSKFSRRGTIFEALCESWDESEQFEELIVKKIYVYVETELMYYTVYFGSFEPTTRDLRSALKQWMYEIPTTKNKTVRMNETNVQVVPQENQLTELAGEIAVLREMLTLLKEKFSLLK